MNAHRSTVRVNLVEDEMFQEKTHIIGSQLISSAVVADKARIEPKDTGSGHDLGRSAG